MGEMRCVLAWTLAAGLLIPVASQGAVYSCRGADGQMAFSDIPCGSNAQKVEVTPAVPGNGAAASPAVLGSSPASTLTPRRALAQEPSPLLGVASQCLSEEGIAAMVSQAPASEKASLQSRLEASNQLQCRHYRRRGGAEALQMRRAQLMRTNP